ncbi:HAD-IA family hydrolase [Pseudorhodoplanes sp.]|uniref:HAD-IA family hydrolase n=1 Tax=Pseudorhodoplanes sp. TaxID=1934341 RepID=UPI00391B8306
MAAPPPTAGKPYSLVIFDLDGTLADSFPWFQRTINTVAREFALRQVAPDDIDDLRRAGTGEILKQLGVPPWKLPRIAKRMRALKREAIGEIPLFPGIAESLHSLRSSGLRLALVSSDSEANAKAQLGASAALFSDVSCGASLFGKAAKFRRVTRQAGALPARTIAIGDEERDLAAARNAGIAFGGVAWGYADPTALRMLGPDIWFERVCDLTERLCGKLSTQALTM